MATVQNPTRSAPVTLSDYFLIALLLFVLAALVRVLMPLSGAILGSLVIAIAFHPLHRQLTRWTPHRSATFHALMTDILVVLFLIVPAILFIWIITREAENLSPTIKGWNEAIQELRNGNAVDSLSPVRRVRTWLTDTLGVSPAEVRMQMGGIARRLIEWISGIGATLAKNSFSFLLNLVVMLITLFFTFRNGDRMLSRFLVYIPLSEPLKRELVEKFHLTVVGILRGWFVTALVQGLVSGIGYWIVGVPAVALLGFLTALVGLIPSVGTALVWLPLGLFYLFDHAYGKGIFLLLWGFLVVSVIDNLLRPYLVKNKADLPFLALFFAIIGGVDAWGTKGILIGPVLIALAPILLEAYRRRYLSHPAAEAEK